MALIADYLRNIFSASGLKLEAREIPLLPVNPNIGTYGFRSIGYAAGAAPTFASFCCSSYVPVENDPSRGNAELLWVRQVKRDTGTPNVYAGAFIRGQGTTGSESFYYTLVAENVPPSRGAQLDGVDDNNANAAGVALDIMNNVTVEAWITPTVGITNAGVFEKSVGGVINTAYSVFITGGAICFSLVRASDSTVQTVSWPMPAGFLGNEHHVAGTFDGSSGAMDLYVDGLPVATINIGAGSAIATGSGTSRIGARHTAGWYFTGVIRDVRVWNVTRSPLEVSAFRQSIVSGKEIGMGASWRVDDTSNYGAPVTQVAERTTGNHGTLTNGASRVPDPGNITIDLGVRNAGVIASLDYFPILLNGADLQDIKIRLRVDGSTQYLKAWRADQEEPNTWGAITTDATVVGAGTLGFTSYCNVGGTLPDYGMPGFLSVGTNGETAPTPMTDLEQRNWMNGDNLRVIIAESVVLGKDVNGTTMPAVVLMSNHGFTTKGSDIPANQVYDDIIDEVPTFSSRAPDEVGGSTSLAWGDLIIKNENGARDHWLTWCWDGRAMDMYMGGIGWRKWDFIKLLSGVVSDPYVPRKDQIGFHLRDKMTLLDRKIQEVMIGGTSTNAGQPKPIAFGKLFNIEPVLIDAATLRYKFGDVSLLGATGIVQVRSSGDSVSYTDRGNCEFTLNAPPTGTGRVTMDVTVDTSTSNLLAFPEDISSWPAGSNLLPYTLNSMLAGDGRRVLDVITPDPAGGVTGHQAATPSVTKAASALVYSFEIDIAPAGYNFARVVLGNSAFTAYSYVDVNLATGAVSGATNVAPFSGAVISSTQLANGVTRVKISTTTDATTVVHGLVQVANTSGNTSFLADGVSGIAIGRAQIYPGDVTCAYFPGLQSAAAGALVGGDRHASLMQTLVEQRAGLGEGTCYKGLRPGSVATLASANNYQIGLYLKDESNYTEILDQIAESAGGFWWFNRVGLFCAAQYRIPAAPFDHVLSEDDISDFKIDKLFLPSDPQQLGYKQNWAPQQDGFDGVVSVADRALFGADAQYTTYIPAISGLDQPTNHVMRRRPRNRITLMADAADALAETTRLELLYRKVCALVTFVVKVDFLNYNLGEVLQLYYPRYGFDTGRPGLILGLVEDFAQSKVTITMLVQLDGKFPTVSATDPYVPAKEFYLAA